MTIMVFHNYIILELHNKIYTLCVLGLHVTLYVYELHDKVCTPCVLGFLVTLYVYEFMQCEIFIWIDIGTLKIINWLVFHTISSKIFSLVKPTKVILLD